jgi:hypothetical protein
LPHGDGLLICTDALFQNGIAFHVQIGWPQFFRILKMLVMMVISDKRRQPFCLRTRQILVPQQHRNLSLGEGRFVLAILTVS